jgi:hypothetical protein
MPVLSVNLKIGSAIWLTKELPDVTERAISRLFRSGKISDLLYETEATKEMISVIREQMSGDLVTREGRRRSARGTIDLILTQVGERELELMINDPRPPGPNKIYFRKITR